MAKKRHHVPPPSKKQGTKGIPPGALEVKKLRSTLRRKPSFRFSHVDPAKYGLQTVAGEQLRQLNQFFSKMEDRTWLQIQQSGGHGRESGGLGYNPIDRKALPALPESVPEDATICEVRVTHGARVFGHRDDNGVFYLVWFDPRHQLLKD